MDSLLQSFNPPARTDPRKETMTSDAPASGKQGEEGSKYVLVDGKESTAGTVQTAASSEQTASKDAKDCPEIVYKVQYKDFSGEIKGTKILDAPYKLKKTA